MPLADDPIRSYAPTPPRNISSRLDGSTVIADLSGDGESEMLFLTRAEATSLAESLELEAVGSAEDEVVVADVPFTKWDAWQLVDAIENVLRDTDPAGLFDWRVFGF